MAGKWDGKTCPVCGKGTLHDGLRLESVDYRGETFTSNQAGAYCDNCDDGIVYDDPAIEQKWEAFRKRIDREQAAELKAIRKRVGLTQEQASKLTGGGHNAISRYECEAAQPVMAVVNMFRLFDRHPELIGELVPGYKAPAKPSIGKLTAGAGSYLDLALLYTGVAYAANEQTTIGVIVDPSLTIDPSRYAILDIVQPRALELTGERVAKPRNIRFEALQKRAQG